MLWIPTERTNRTFRDCAYWSCSGPMSSFHRSSPRSNFLSKCKERTLPSSLRFISFQLFCQYGTVSASQRSWRNHRSRFLVPNCVREKHGRRNRLSLWVSSIGMTHLPFCGANRGLWSNGILPIWSRPIFSLQVSAQP